MVVVDSSALIPLAEIGRLDLVTATFDDVRTTEGVTDEVLVEGRPGTAALRDFLETTPVHEPPAEAEAVAEVEGIAVADAAVILVASDVSEPLLANDKALIQVARTHGVDGRWVTSLLLDVVADGVLPSSDAIDILYALIEQGMYLHPKVLARVQRALDDLDD